MNPRERFLVSIEAAMEDAHGQAVANRPASADEVVVLHENLLRALGEARLLMLGDAAAEAEMQAMNFEPALRQVIFATRNLYRSRSERRRQQEISH
jgi:hypothetical protein